jgi:hypothetical protein
MQQTDSLPLDKKLHVARKYMLPGCAADEEKGPANMDTARPGRAWVHRDHKNRQPVSRSVGPEASEKKHMKAHGFRQNFANCQLGGEACAERSCQGKAPTYFPSVSPMS